MFARWFSVFCSAALSIVGFGQNTMGLQPIEMVTTTGNQTVFTNSHDEQYSVTNSVKPVNLHNELTPLGLEESEGTKVVIQPEETTPSEHGFKSVESSPVLGHQNTAVFLGQWNSTEETKHVNNRSVAVQVEADSTTCNTTNDLQQQHGLDPESNVLSPRDSKTTICLFEVETSTSPTSEVGGQLVSLATVATARFVTQEVIMPAIAIPGCVFNIISIHILVKQGAESSSTRYLIALAAADLSFLFSSLLNWMIVLLSKSQYPFYFSLRLALRFEWLHGYFILLTGRYSNTLVLLFSLDRFIAVKFPLMAKTSPLSRHSAKFSLGLFVFIAFLMIPNLFRTEYVEVIQPETNKSDLAFTLTVFSASNQQFYKVYTYFLVVTLRFLPILLIFVLNVAIILVVKSARNSSAAKGVTDEKRQRRELKITRMLVTISLIFLMCVTPALVNAIISNFYPAYSFFGPYRNIFQVMFDFFPLLDAINSTVNFFVYVLLGEKFREVFLETFCRRFTTKSEMGTGEQPIGDF